MILSSYGSIFGQEPCSFDDYQKELLRNNPQLEEKLKLSEKSYHTYFKSSGPSSSRATYTLPVVFHVIHNGGIENISNNRILQSLDWVNKSLANEAPYGNPDGSVVDVELCIANQDPAGNPTNGINRVMSNLTDFDMLIQDNALKNLIQWDSKQYINVWIVKEVRKGTSNSVAGYATLPGSHGSATDGVVMEATFVGDQSFSNGIFSHEVGHYLGLYHTFQGGCLNNDCMTQGDRVCDTPPDATNIPVPCETTLNSCDTDADSGYTSDQNDKNNNFMDYNTLKCTNQFTPGQADRMRYFVTNDRASLLSSIGCLAPCEDPISIDIVASNLNPQPNEPVTIINNSTNTSSYEWYLSNVLESTLAEPTFTFTSPGIYEIILHAFGAEANCFAFDTLVFEVQCTAIATFSPIITDCIEFDAIPTLTYDGAAGTNIEWYINGDLVTTDPSFVPTFSAGPNFVELLASNAYCTSTFSQYIFVSCNEICGNGFDDDGDGLIDCFDTDCCDECEDFYYDACAIDDDCFNYAPFTIVQKWETTQQIHSGIQQAVGDLDQDGNVEIIAVGLGNSNRLRIFDGNGNNNGSIGPFNEINFRSAPTIGDVDGDGTSEILFINDNQAIVCLNSNGTEKYRSIPGLMPGCCLTLGAMLQLSDLNYDGNPEIIMGNKVLNAQTGELIVDGTSIGASQGEIASGSVNSVNGVSVANILSDDNPAYPRGLEIITGNQILSVDIDAKIMKIEVEYPGINDSYGAAIDYDQDGDLDVYTVSNATVIVWEGQTPDLMMTNTFPNRISTFPVIANLDDDPELESVVGLRPTSFFADDHLIALENDLSTKWMSVVDEFSSSTPIGFDFNLDGKIEIIHRSDKFLRVINGENGEEMFIDPCGAGTNFEHPIIVDIDGDGHAELLIGCADESEYRGRLRAYEGVDEWPMTRAVASHYGLINTQINDDLSIPQFAQESFIKQLRPGINTYLTAYAYTEEPGPIDVSVVNFNFDLNCDSSNQITFNYQIINNAPFPIEYIYMESIYNGNPELVGSSLLINDSPNLSVTIPGLDTVSRSITIDLTGIDLSESHQWCLLINDDGLATLPIDWELDFPLDIQRECNYEDNISCIDYEPDTLLVDLLPDVISLCGAAQLILQVEGEWEALVWNDSSTADSLIVNLPGKYWVTATNDNCNSFTDTISITLGEDAIELMLPDTLFKCNNNIVNIVAPEGYQTYKWHDGTDLRIYSAFSEGLHVLTVTDFCNRTFADSTFIVSLPLELELPDSITVCANIGDTLLTFPLFENIDVFPEIAGACTDCNEIELPTDESRYYQFIAYSFDGCIVLDSIYVNSVSPEDELDSFYFCKGDTILFNNQLITETTEVIENLICANTRTTRFITFDFGFSYDLTLPCLTNDDGQVNITANGKGPFTYLLDDVEIGSETISDLGAGSYNLKVVDANGCELEENIILESFIPPNSLTEVYELCVGDSIFIEGTWIYQNQEIEFVSLDCDTMYNIEVLFNEGPVLDIYVDQPCFGFDNGLISLDIVSTGSYTIDWNEISSDSSQISNLSEGNYQVTVTDDNNCSTTAQITLESHSELNGSIVAQYEVETGSSIQLLISDIENALSISWMPATGLSCDDCLDPVATLASDQEYHIDIMDENGCSLQLQTSVIVKNTSFYMPNIFSPNSDDVNDIFSLISSEPYTYDLQIFDRWGGIMYDGKLLNTVDKRAGWDGTSFGKRLNSGVYVYVVTIYGDNDDVVIAGDITLTY